MRVGALQNSIALLKSLAICLCNADWLRPVLTNDQDTAAQVIVLKAAGYERIYCKKACGGRWNRPNCIVPWISSARAMSR
jgi:hypothetical protein